MDSDNLETRTARQINQESVPTKTMTSKQNPMTNGAASKVQVVLPTVKIRVEDLSALKGIAERGIKCNPSWKSSARLRILGLIEDQELPPCPKQKAELRARRKLTSKAVLKAISGSQWDWKALGSISWYGVASEPQPRKVTVITPAGKALLAKGSALVTVQKGC